MKDKRRFDFIPNRLNKYSIRKFSVGIASILVGATLFFGLNNEAKADEVNVTSEHGNKNGENASSTSEDETDHAQTQETTQSDAPTPEASQETQDHTTSRDDNAGSTASTEQTQSADSQAISDKSDLESEGAQNEASKSSAEDKTSEGQQDNSAHSQEDNNAAHEDATQQSENDSASETSQQDEDDDNAAKDADDKSQADKGSTDGDKDKAHEDKTSSNDAEDQAQDSKSSTSKGEHAESDNKDTDASKSNETAKSDKTTEHTKDQVTSDEQDKDTASSNHSTETDKSVAKDVLNQKSDKASNSSKTASEAREEEAKVSAASDELDTLAEDAETPEELYEKIKDLSSDMDKSKALATLQSRASSSPIFRQAYAATASNEKYNGKIIDFDDPLVKKVDQPNTALAPSDINFSPRFKEGKSKSYAFIIDKDGKVSKKQLATRNNDDIRAYKGNYIRLNNDNPEAYVYFSDIGVANGKTVDALAHVTMNPSENGDRNNTRYFMTSGTDVLSLLSDSGGGAHVDLSFYQHADQSKYDDYYNQADTKTLTKNQLFDDLASMNHKKTKVSGLFNVYDLDDYDKNKAKDVRKSITFNRNEIDNLYISNEKGKEATSLLELDGDDVTITSGPGAASGTYENNKRVTVSYLDKSDISYTMTGRGSSGPAFDVKGLLLKQIPPYNTDQRASASKGDAQLDITQEIPARDVDKKATLPSNLSIGVEVPEGIRLALEENADGLFTSDSSQSSTNKLSIVPGMNGKKDLSLLEKQKYFDTIQNLTLTLTHGLTLSDVENNTDKWTKLKDYYDKDSETLKVPVKWSFNNGDKSWDNLETDVAHANLKLPDDVKALINQINDAEEAVEAAKRADQDAKDQLQDENSDQLITPGEHDKLIEARDNARDKKAEAQRKVDALPQAQKRDLPDQLARLTGIDVPDVNDANENGVDDKIDAQREEAEHAVEAAKNADQAAQDKLKEANADGLITPDEHKALEKAAQDAADAKQNAQDKVDVLPDDQKGDMPGELDKLNGIDVPDVNDSDSNGISDDIDQQREEAKAAVDAAKNADQAAQDKFKEANADGLITPDEHDALEKANKDAADAKQNAQEKVDALPSDQRGNMPSELEKLNGIDVPDVNDSDANGVSDEVDQQREEAQAAVNAAKNADQAAQDKLKEANADGLITPDEHDALEKANQAAADAKQSAQAKVDALPSDQRGDMPSDLEKLHGIDVPDVNDSDANGVSDDVDRQREEAQSAVNAAKSADQAVQDKLKAANADGLITPDEHDALEKANQDAADAKRNAQDKVDALPSDQRGDMPGELDKLNGIDMPDVNDSDANGVSDDVDRQREEAQSAVDAAKNADQAAQDKLKEANADGLITPDEHDALEKANQAAADAKQNAQEKVDALPSDQRGEIPSDLEELHGIDIPDVNDSDANGVSDDVDQQREEAQAAVDAAKSADQAAQDKLKAANADGLITPDEHEALEQANQKAADAKQNAQDKVDALPSDQRGEMPSDLEKLHGIDVPDVNDSDANGVSDEVDKQREEAQSAVNAAESADQSAQDKLKEANADGLITPDEHEALEKANQDAAEAKKNAQEKVDALPSDQRGNMPDELAKLHGIDVPDVNDSDANGVSDDVDQQREEAQAAVDAAKSADQAAQDKLKEANADGLITPDEHDALEKANQDAADAKKNAQEKVDALPSDQRGDMPSELDQLHGIDIPDVNDSDSNGVSDDVDAQREEAQAAVDAAKNADQAAQDKLKEANADGLITPDEHDALEKANQDAAEAKQNAQDKVDALPSDQRGNMLSDLEKLHGIDVPDVNDSDSNGVSDDVDTQREEAQAAVDAAKSADQAAQDKLKEANADGLITPDEHDALEKANQAAADAKQNAQDKVDALPSDQRGEMPSELEKLNGIDVPDVNDSDANGVSDDVDSQREEAQAAVDAAKSADQAAQDKLKEANADGLITPDEHKALEKANQDAEDAKQNAQEKVDALPSDQRGEMPNELDKLHGIDIPDVNDSDSNGVSDDVDAQREEAQAAVDAAKSADQAAQDKLKEANANGLITPDEHDALEKANQDAADAKQNAQDKVDALPSDQQGNMPEELDKLHGIDVPDVNDSDANGVSDDVDQQREEAQAAVDAAKSADQAAQDKLKEANADGLITPDEHEALEKANQNSADAKQNAQEKVDALPSDQRGDMPSDLEKLHGIDIPDVNDSDANGVSDEIDKQREEAQNAVNAAKNADQAAQDKLKEANADGLITPDEHEALVKANQEAADAKQNAQDKVDALPSDQRGDMPSDLEKLHGIDIPDVNDSDANGVSDDVDAQREKAQSAVDVAKNADQAAQDKLKEANVDGLITPDEHDALEKANQDAADAKRNAQEKVDALPSDQRGDMPSELDKLNGINVPDVNDSDANGVSDEVDQQREEAQAAVDAAKNADQAAQNKLKEANADGLITPDEHDALEKANQAAADAKRNAQDKVDALPSDQRGNMPSELDNLHGINVPDVNDSDSNGVSDDIDKQREEAQAAVDAAKSADQAAQDKLKEANADGLITPDEHDALEKANQDAVNAKQNAQAKVDALPSEQRGDMPQEIDKLHGIDVPDVNDSDANGVADDVDQQREGAQAAVDAAKSADQAAQDKLKEANADGLITPDEHDALEKANKDAADAKQNAQEKVDALPSDQRGEMPSELDELHGINIPDVNDSDSNGVSDDVDKQREEAQAAVNAAKSADQAAQDKLKEANADGLITPDEHEALEKANQDAVDAKQNAQAKVDALPSDQRGEMPSELEKLNGIDIPDVNDSDANGVSDEVDAQREEAQAAVDAAKNADQAAQDKLKEANADGLITPDEHDALEKANQDAADAKQNAQAKVDALPSDQKGDMPNELDKLNGIDVPDVNDSDSNGVSDDVDNQREEAQAAVDAAKNADQAAQDKLKEANADGLITPDEHEALEKANQNAVDAKQNAQEKVDALPSDQRGDMSSDLEKLHGIDIPDVNDADSNGVSDDVDQQREAAQAAVDAAKSADQEAQDKLKEANADGLITPDEHEALEQANQKAADAKQNAQAKVDALPSDQRGDMQSDLEKLHGIDVPDVNDADSNGVSDDVDNQRNEAQEAVDAAKHADQAAQDKLKEANADGLITPGEHEALEKANQDAADAKQNAQEKVDALPSDQRGDMPSELNQLHGINIPDVNDSDSNGVSDDVDTQREEAQAAVDAAKNADKAAQDKLKEANADGLITPYEHDALEKANQDAADAKKNAQDKVDALPSDQRGDMSSDLEKLHGIDIPDVNDSDANGVSDDVDRQREEAQAAVDAAKNADQAAQDKLKEVNADGLITPDEHDALEKANQEAADAKQNAQNKVDALPSDQRGNMSEELDKLHGIDVPDVNDSDSNGVSDDVDNKREEAQAAVDAAKSADQAAQDKLKEANADGLITPDEHDALEKANQDAADAKQNAQEKVDALPSDQRGKMPSELDNLHGINVPEVNDSDSNGVSDDVDNQRNEAQAVVDAAKHADQVAQDKLKEAQADGLITPDEHDALEKANQAAAEAKQNAQAKVDALPSDQRGDMPSELDKLHGIDVPEVNDSDANGVADSIDEQRNEAQQAIDAAKRTDQIAQDKLKEAQADGIITPAEHDELEKANQDAANAKQVAQDKVNTLPDTQKAILQPELDALHGIEVPQVSEQEPEQPEPEEPEPNNPDQPSQPSQDHSGDVHHSTHQEQPATHTNDQPAGNTTSHTRPTVDQAQHAVDQAQQADHNAKEKLQQAMADQVITTDEQHDLAQAQQSVIAAKQQAQAQINQLPAQEQSTLQAELDTVTNIEIPSTGAHPAGTTPQSPSHTTSQDEDALPDTGEQATSQGTILGSMAALIGSLFLFRKRRKHKDEQ
ncbi:YSIRK-type signal peptide-containing protein [Staphylococcus pettenkoferi]|nr:YSIRK-type signal peptide-containing protein [Staphylococcus pettenkoferi]MDK7283561.1 YSIRK-type signal peptide-containing protein [Staphylococcus pettenkoferi]